MIKAVISILSNLKWGNILKVALTVIAISAIIFFAWNGVKATIIAPAVNKAIEPLNTTISELKADTTQLNESLRLQIANNAKCVASLDSASSDFSKRIESMQGIVKQVEDRKKADARKYEHQLEQNKTEINNLRAGVLVRTITLQKRLLRSELDTVNVVERWGL